MAYSYKELRDEVAQQCFVKMSAPLDDDDEMRDNAFQAFRMANAFVQAHYDAHDPVIIAPKGPPEKPEDVG